MSLNVGLSFLSLTIGEKPKSECQKFLAVINITKLCIEFKFKQINRRVRHMGKGNRVVCCMRKFTIEIFFNFNRIVLKQISYEMFCYGNCVDEERESFEKLLFTTQVLFRKEFEFHEHGSKKSEQASLKKINMKIVTTRLSIKY